MTSRFLELPRLAAVVVFPVAAALTAVPCLSASTSSTDDAKSISDLTDKVDKLGKDIDASLGSLTSDDGQLDCLNELDHLLDVMYEQLLGFQHLVSVSMAMRDAIDQRVAKAITANYNVEILSKWLTYRKATDSVSAHCSKSALVNGYAHQMTSLIDEATDVLGRINQPAK
jgi:hypothetical protein